MAETTRLARSGPLIPSEPYRNPATLIPLVQNISTCDFYFVFTHGELIPNTGPYRFLTPADTIVIQTGGDETLGCLVSTDLDRSLLPSFQPRTIGKTFQFFLGERGNLRDAILTAMLFNTPAISSTDYTLNKRITLGLEDFTPGQLWGVFKLEPLSIERNRLVRDDSLTRDIILSSGLTQEEFIQNVRNKSVSYKPKIFFFLNCAAAEKVYPPAEFSGSLQIATQKTQYSRGNIIARHAGVSVSRGGPSGRPRIQPVQDLTNEERAREINTGHIARGLPENEVHNFNNLLEAAYSNTENKGCLGRFCQLFKGLRKKKTKGGTRRNKKRHTTRKLSPK